MNQIAPGIYTLPMEFEFQGETQLIHPAAIETGTGLILVDTGLPHHAGAIETTLDESGFGFDDIEIVVLTHQDPDHAGAVSEVKARSGATIVAHADDVPYIDGTRDPIKGGGDRYPPEPVDIEVVDGVVFRTLGGPMRVVATPGHTPGHVSLYFPDESLLIAADALTAQDEFGGPRPGATPDMDTAIDSVGRLAALDVERTLCFHGGLIDHDPDRIAAIHESLR